MSTNPSSTVAAPSAGKHSTDEDRIIIFDTTLRDGEQSPGASMTVTEKLKIAELLEQMGVDVIEAGFAIASEGDFRAVNEIARKVKDSVVCSLARAGRADIDRAAEALEPAARKRIHTFIATSPLHMAVKLQKTPEQVHEAVIDSVTHARRYCDDVEWSCEDGSRSEHDFLCRCVESAIEAGATTINIPDTVGYAYPEEFADLIRMIRNRVPNIDKAVISVHCHNDLGLAVANSLRAVQAGARQVECTVNGIGERAGNAALEEIVMAMHIRADRMPYEVGIERTKIYPSSELLTSLTGQGVQVNKAIVGRNAFAHEAGIHQDGILKDRRTYEIMRAEDVGAPWNPLVIGKHSGRHAVQQRCSELGFTLEALELVQVYRGLMAIADDRKTLTDNDIVAVVSAIRMTQPPAHEAVDPFDTPSTVPTMHESGYGHGV